MYYSGLALDRANGRRSDQAWVAALLAKEQTQVIPLWRDSCLVRDGSPVVPQVDGAQGILAAAGDPVLLGLDDEAAVFAADLSALEHRDAVELAGADAVLDVRHLVSSVTETVAGVLAYARGMLHWSRNQRYCGACGGRTSARDGGHLRICLDCGKLMFPRIEPAVIVLTELPGEPRRCLLGRHRGAEPDRFTTLAGFVEIGESLEDAVRREVAEEAGVIVGAVSYQGSQAWPFPSGLMVAFRAEALSETIGVDGTELIEARWFTAGELRGRISASGGKGPYRADSIGKVLTDRWLSESE
jgi:NAD+ diphosphatase